MTIKAQNISPGDRVVVRGYNRTAARTVQAVGDNYIVVSLCGHQTKVPEHKISSHVAG